MGGIEGDGTKIGDLSVWRDNKVGKTLVVQANFETGIIVYKDKESGEEVAKIEDKTIYDGSKYYFFVTLCAKGTKIQLVNE